jgi:hypothetical protein
MNSILTRRGRAAWGRCRLMTIVLLGLIAPAGAGQPMHRVAHEAPALDLRGQPPAARGTGATVVHNGFVSHQVNIDTNGMNIVGDAANEPSLAIDPTDPSRIVIVWRQFDTVASDFRQAGWGYSHDGGTTWTAPGIVEPGIYRTDPVIDVDVDGVFYFYSLTSDFTCQTFISTDAGLSWLAPIPAFGGDKAWMAVDRTPSPGRGHLYAAWDDIGCCGDGWFTRSVDGGLTYDQPVPIPLEPIWGVTAVGPRGEVYVAGRLLATAETFAVARSSTARNAGAPLGFDFATAVDLGGAHVFFPNLGPNPRGLLGQVWVATDHSLGPRRGNVYLLCSVDPPDTDAMDLRFARSVDGGLTWSAPIDPRPDGPMGILDLIPWQWFGTLSVAPNGRLDIAWFETLNDASFPFSQLLYSYSLDGGDTWRDAIEVSPEFNHWLGWPNQQFKIGDYFDMISDNAGISIAYSATFNQEQDIYYVRVDAVDCDLNGVLDSTDIAQGATDCNSNGQPDTCDVALGASFDCDANGTPDECETLIVDCNSNGISDLCELLGDITDCNANGVLDECDIQGGTAVDIDTDGVPDSCAPPEDCNSNGTPDALELAGNDCDGDGRLDLCQFPNVDCNSNGAWDACDLIAGTSADCQTNGVPDDCELVGNDCDENGIPDECTLPGNDCDGSGILDGCELAAGSATDCDSNGVPDRCEITDADCNFNGVLDPCDIAAGTSEDCDHDAVPDDCALAAGTASDCNATGIPDACELVGNDCDSNGIPDECALATGDCNVNGLLDACEVAAGSAGDCDGNLLPDECTPPEDDCNTNAIPDLCDIAAGTSADCNANTQPDECDLAQGADRDCDNNGVPDLCELLNSDCNQNLVLDACDITAGTANDCDANLEPDECVIAADPSADCDGNTVLDVCELAGNDCNTNGVLDRCELAAAPGRDCDTNGVLDECDVNLGSAADCDGNLRPDVCDLADGDCNTNAVPDRCELAGNDCNRNALPDDCEPELFVDDCNGNNTPDLCEIVAGTAVDWNLSGVLDECEVAPCAVDRLDPLVASDREGGDFFGGAVAADGDWVVIGAYGEDALGFNAGAVYIYRFDGESWVEEAKLLASDGQAGDEFGFAVDISGDAVLVGAPSADNPQNLSGAAYVFRYTGSGWVEEAKLLDAPAPFNGELGRSVALDGDLAVLGAPGRTGNAPQSGTAVVFRKTQNDWTVEAELKSTGAASSDFFGRSVAVAGDTILVGAFGDDETAPGAGAAYVFRNAGGWSQEAKLRADDGTASDFFGSAVALDGVRALIGARGESASMLAAGAAYVFAHDGAGWVQQQKLVAADAGTYDSFGVAVALHGAEVFIGAQGSDSLGANAGAAYLFRFDGNAWNEYQVLREVAGSTDDQYGFSVGLSSSAAVVGGYFGSFTGIADVVWRFDPDCNANAQRDVCDVTAGLSVDCNVNLIPDDCETLSAGDFNANGAAAEAGDMFGFSQCCSGPGALPVPGGGICPATCLAVFDLDQDGDVDARDYAELQKMTSAGRAGGLP